MSKTIVAMFSGQGSQYFKMGGELYKMNSRYRAWMDLCSEICEPLIGESLVDILYSGDTSKPFDNLQHVSPALLAAQYSMFQVLSERGVKPDLILGYSFGEIVAAVAAGSLGLETGLDYAFNMSRLVQERLSGGGMLAILSSEKITEEYPDIFKNLQIACHNFSNHFVVSGHIDDIDAAKEFLNGKKITSEKLHVNHAFHNTLFESVRDDLSLLSGDIYFLPPNIPIVSCSKAQILEQVDNETFLRAISLPVEYSKTIQYVEDKFPGCTYIDLGCSATLATFNRYVISKTSQSKSYFSINPYGKNVQTLNSLLENIESSVESTVIS